MPNTQKDYHLLECTTSLCSECLERIDAKIVLRDKKIILLKYCRSHGAQEAVLEDDADYYLKRLDYTKPGTTAKTQTTREHNCPYDCGLCQEHEQHTCIGLIEITEECDLGCPVCYADSGQGASLSLGKVEEMLDFLVDSENGEAEILQISGGEPTTHPQIIEILELARQKKIKYLMLNTNGLRIAQDDGFAEELARFEGNFEVYLQFDGFSEKAHQSLRGRNLASAKQEAIKRLSRSKIPTTLVCTLEKDTNDKEIGKIVEFGLNTDCVRGINFQPIAFFGRQGTPDVRSRMTVTGVIREIEEQTGGMIRRNDFIPLPCNVDRVAITYLYRTDQGFIPLTRNLDAKKYLPLIRNTFKFDPEDFLGGLADEMFKSNGCCDYLSSLRKLKKIIPTRYLLMSEKEKINYVSENTFRISVTSFIDAGNFDMRSMKKECVHIVTPDLKKIPFSAYNLLHRKKYDI